MRDGTLQAVAAAVEEAYAGVDAYLLKLAPLQARERQSLTPRKACSVSRGSSS